MRLFEKSILALVVFVACAVFVIHMTALPRTATAAGAGPLSECRTVECKVDQHEITLRAMHQYFAKLQEKKILPLPTELVKEEKKKK